MSVPMQLVKQPVLPVKTEGKASLGDLLSLDLTPEEGQAHALDYIFRLQDEMRALRHELAEARRSLAQKDVLLKNYLRREQILRAQLIEGKY